MRARLLQSAVAFDADHTKPTLGAYRGAPSPCTNNKIFSVLFLNFRLLSIDHSLTHKNFLLRPFPSDDTRTNLKRNKI